nr:MAG TPA: hypothetical protein [Caudoviricetes sp.]
MRSHFNNTYSYYQKDRTRTYDTSVNSRVLYQLSYLCTNTTVRLMRTLNTLIFQLYNAECVYCTVHTLFCLVVLRSYY